MSEDVWNAPGASHGAPFDGAPLDMMDPIRITIADFQANPLTYVTSGLGYVVATMILLVVALGALGVGILPGAILEDETLLMVGGIFGFSIYTLSILIFSFIGFPLMSANLHRAAHQQLEGHATMGFTSLFGIGEKPVQIVLFYLLGQALILVGVLFLYLPGLIAAALVQFTFPIIVNENIGTAEAMRRAFGHMRENPGWHLGVWALLFVLVIVAELTIVGLLFLFPLLHIYSCAVYKVAFPNGTS